MLFNSFVEDRNGPWIFKSERKEIEIPIDTSLVAIRYYFLLFNVDFKGSSDR